jgi:opacity protein-like surface antigen
MDTRHVLMIVSFITLSVNKSWAQESVDPLPKNSSDVSNIKNPNFTYDLKTKGAERALSHKFFMRGSAGTINNVGTVTGSTVTYGGSNLGIALFYLEQVSFGFSYKVETTFSSIPLRGFDVFGRYYYLGPGTKVVNTDSLNNKFVSHRTWNPYLGGEFSNREFSFELDPTATNAEDRSVSGNISAMNFLAGLDYRLSRNWEINLELSYTLFPLGGNDPRFKIKWMLLSWGVNYVF